MNVEKQFMLLTFLATALIGFSCSTIEKGHESIIKDSFIETQNEIRTILDEIYTDAKNKNIERLKAIHLNSPKFSKFGPRSFERQTVEETNNSEENFFSSISDLNIELNDVKIDVFGKFAIATYYPNYSFKREGQLINGISRQTLVFLKTEQGWKIVHEHGTPKPDSN